MVEARRTTKVAKILPQCVKIYEIFRSIFSVCREVTAARRRRKRRETKINFPTSANLASENLFSFIHSAFARAKRSASGGGRVGTISIRLRLPLPYRLLTRREILVVNLENCARLVALTLLRPPSPLQSLVLFTTKFLHIFRAMKKIFLFAKNVCFAKNIHAEKWNEENISGDSSIRLNAIDSRPSSGKRRVVQDV